MTGPSRFGGHGENSHGDGGGGAKAPSVPDDYVVVRGGTGSVPSSGEVFSGAAGQTLEEAASGVPHGQIRVTTAGDIRNSGGSVEFAPETTRSGAINHKHVNITVGEGPNPFGALVSNPVARINRIS